jgi:hypothetical protein
VQFHPALTLNAKQAVRIRHLVIDKMPDQLTLPFYLWTRAVVTQLIAHEYGVRISLTSVGRYSKTWGMSAQKPARRAYERNDEAIARWLAEDYPAIARQAKRDTAAIYWGDEMGLRSDHVTGTSDAPLGQTPVVRATGQRFGCNMISATTTKARCRSWSFPQDSQPRCLWISCVGCSSRPRAGSI